MTREGKHESYVFGDCSWTKISFPQTKHSLKASILSFQNTTVMNNCNNSTTFTRQHVFCLTFWQFYSFSIMTFWLLRSQIFMHSTISPRNCLLYISGTNGPRCLLEVRNMPQDVHKTAISLQKPFKHKFLRIRANRTVFLIIEESIVWKWQEEAGWVFGGCSLSAQSMRPPLRLGANLLAPQFATSTY